jgi:hypothetical protein
MFNTTLFRFALVSVLVVAVCALPMSCPKPAISNPKGTNHGNR